MSAEQPPLLRAVQAAARDRDSQRRRGLEPLEVRCERSAFNRESAPQFVNHLLKTHHPHLEERLRRVEKSIVHVAAKHGLAHGNTWSLANIFVELAESIRDSLACEVRLLGTLPLPAGGEDVDAVSWRSRYEEFAATRQPQGEDLDAMFHQVTELTTEVAASRCRCPTYCAMLDEVAALQRDYRTHCTEQQQYLAPQTPT